ncbi:UNVERIFIED_CONTAM: hypothetical protein NCL1_15245 [Trichonephila clavipes]
MRCFGCRAVAEGKPAACRAVGGHACLFGGGKAPASGRIRSGIQQDRRAAGSGAVHPASGADEPRYPRQRLCEGRCEDRLVHAGGAVCAGTLHRGATFRRTPLDTGYPRLQFLSYRGGGRPGSGAHAGGGDTGQPVQGFVRSGDPECQPDAGAGGDCGADAGPRLPVRRRP